MSLNLLAKINDFLMKNPEREYTSIDIANHIFVTYPDECKEKQKRSTATLNPLNSDIKLIKQIAAEIGAQRPDQKMTKIKRTEGRPRKYYYSESSDIEVNDFPENISESADAPERDKINEYDLYPVLANFLWSEFKIHSKRINEKRGSNRNAGSNKWLYPDLVGMEDLSQDWHREIKDCVKEYTNKKTRLWSFEVKILINRANVREVFFQTVSNSSWANFSYLVASEMKGSDTLKELRMLASLHGIGFILLDADNPSESQIMIPAKERPDLDWNSTNRLAKENKDFLKYINLIRQFYQTGEVRSTDWLAKVYED